MKTPLIMMLITIFSSCTQVQTRNLNNGMEDLSAQIVRDMVSQKKAKIAVIEFSDLEGKRSNIGKFTSEELTAKLFKSGKFHVVERSMMQKIFTEQEFSVSGMVDEKSARKIGKILGVDAICSGTITDLGKTVKINARLISTETGSLFSVASAEIEKDHKVENLMAVTGEIKERNDAKQKNKTSSSDVNNSADWKYARDVKLVYRLNAGGDIECASYDGKNCLWGLNLKQISFNKIKPVACGEHHYRLWGDTGYASPEHWCQKLKLREQ